jgi:hypothetical protein
MKWFRCKKLVTVKKSLVCQNWMILGKKSSNREEQQNESYTAHSLKKNLFDYRAGNFFSFPPCPDWLWGPPSLLSNRYQGLYPQG